MTDTDSVDNTNTEIVTHNNGRGVMIEEWEKTSDTDWNDNFYPHRIIINEWEELEAISSSKL
ncbi:hypothetical protein H8356DRAFT_1430681 [Neocallimastix lanati (nom. inval.)]|nr:hypothetical protein H8356DRAFT_1430681 [Neocallimastix sp. JGI-2020a]